MEEAWKEIEGFNGVEISNLGNIRSQRIQGSTTGARSDEPRMLRTKSNNHGYICINLRDNGKSKVIYVHRAVAQAFIPNPNNFPQVNHKDEDKSNNCIDNLEWCDSKYNQNYGSIRKRISEAKKGKQTGENNPFFGKHHSEETRKKLSQLHTGTTASNETKKKLSEMKQREKNAFFGKHHSEETKKKLSEMKKGKQSGENNPMFDKSAYENKTKEEIELINKKKSESLK